MIGKIWNFLFLIFLIILVISIVAMAEKILTDENPITSIHIKNVKSLPKNDTSKHLNDAKDEKNESNGKTDKTEAPVPPISKDNKKKSGSSGGSNNNDQKSDTGMDKEEIFDLWMETLLENGLSEEFVNKSIKVQDYKMSQINNDEYLKIYLTYIVDWANISVVYPVMVNSAEPIPKITGNLVISASGKNSIKEDIIKKMVIFKKRKIITKDEYMNLVKKECFNDINISSINPEFYIKDNYVMAEYFGFFPGEENKCALSRVNLEDKESFCEPQQCIKVQILG